MCLCGYNYELYIYIFWPCEIIFLFIHNFLKCLSFVLFYCVCFLVFFEMSTTNDVGFMKKKFIFDFSNVMEILEENLLASSSLL